MTRYVGLDLHKHIVQASLINEEGKRLESHRFACTQESLLAFARERLRPEDQIALEATTNTWAVAALLRPFVAKIVVANPAHPRDRRGESQDRQGRCRVARAAAALRLSARGLATGSRDPTTQGTQCSALRIGCRSDPTQKPCPQPARTAADLCSHANALRGGGPPVAAPSGAHPYRPRDHRRLSALA